MAFFKKKNKIDNTAEQQDWNKDIKRNRAIGSDAIQQGFDFNENADLNSDRAISGTKKGLSIYIENMNADQIKILQNCKEENTADELINILKRTNKSKFKNDILNPLLDLGFFERSIPEKPKSPNQKYRLTGLFVKNRPII